MSLLRFVLAFSYSETLVVGALEMGKRSRASFLHLSLQSCSVRLEVELGSFAWNGSAFQAVLKRCEMAGSLCSLDSLQAAKHADTRFKQVTYFKIGQGCLLWLGCATMPSSSLLKAGLGQF